ncbi:hypothetical protein AVEN_129870-1 [Araneus ventricosus]|uniref:Uncharacterized protein n=1 Tax=Araneus ventricosus TaxID=182803 RepID=A0A4Y2QUJ6_ARAVE|nr:hypothetical protein AVEN_129870-1 [Araneus ventricosus]
MVWSGALVNVQPYISLSLSFLIAPPRHSIFQPIHLGGSFTDTPRKPIHTGHSDPLVLLYLLRHPLSKRDPLPTCIYCSRTSTFIARQSEWISREDGYPNFRPHHANSHRFFALTTGFGAESLNVSNGALVNAQL